MLAAEVKWLLYKGKESFAESFVKARQKKEDYNFEKAFIYFTSLLEIDPSNGNAHRILGLIYKLLGEYDIAVAHLGQAVFYYNKDVEAYVLLGQIYGDVYHQHEKALEYVSKALELRPKHYLALLCRGYNKGQLGQHEEAISALNEAMGFGSNLGPEDMANAYFYLGQNKMMLRQYDEAIKDFTIALPYDHKIEIYQMRGLCREKMRDYAGALQDYKEYHRLKPQEAEANQAVFRVQTLIQQAGQSTAASPSLEHT